MSEQQGERPGFEPDWQAIHAALQAHVETVYPVGRDRTITGQQVNENLQGVDLQPGMTDHDKAELAYQLTDDYQEDEFQAYMERAEAEYEDEHQDEMTQTFGDDEASF